MRIIIFAIFITIFSSATMASESSLKAVGLETTDSTGCYLTDGKNQIGPTIGVMVSAYDTPSLKNDIVTQIIKVAIDAGCNIETPDSSGLSPLNAAILFNQPQMVKLLLENGANPNLTIANSKDYLNGMNSFQFVAFLVKKGNDLSEITVLLNSASKNA